jgi:hypothetical protein
MPVIVPAPPCLTSLRPEPVDTEWINALRAPSPGRAQVPWWLGGRGPDTRAAIEPLRKGFRVRFERGAVSPG